MLRTMRRSIGRVGFAAAVAGLGFAGLVAASSTPGSAATTKVTLDHFLCYSATGGKGFKVPAKLDLENVLNPTFFPPSVGKIALHCNPTVKVVATATGLTKTYKVTHPRDHLLCWSIAYKSSPKIVTLTNQFGTAVFTEQSPTALCLPSWKSLKGNPNTKPTTPPGLDHFTCYPITALKGRLTFTIPASVRVKDEFSSRLVHVGVGLAQLLCVPTTKIANGVAYKPQTAPDASLTCFQVTKTPTKNPVYDENQFGQGPIQIVKTKYLCLPTKVSVQGPAA